jgi:hypothetical protein
MAGRVTMQGLGLVLGAVFVLVGGALGQPSPATIAANHTTAVIKLDGRLDEPAWQEAQVITLTQQSPWPGKENPYRTEVRVLISGQNLYFGFRCSDPKPEAIAIHTLQRDGDVSGDDTVSIVLDTYGDRRTGYFFQINAGGARVDGLISTVKTVSTDWDTIWDARTERTKDGWTAEIVIPALSLSFTRGLETWGLNVERFIARDHMTLRWTSPTLDSFLFDLSRAGSLTGVGVLHEGHGIEFSPYVSGRTTDDFSVNGRGWQATGGGDVSWRIAPQMTTVVTLNTDFAEADVDTRQINVTRFPLFFPEKRAFFLEGSNQFDFGLGLNKTETARYGVGIAFLPFFTRRIGLRNGVIIPIDVGIKLSGRAGKWNVGVLDVETRDNSGVPGTNLFGGRVSYDVNKKLRVGTIVTHGDPQNFEPNTLIGFDGVWRTSTLFGNKNLLAGAWVAANAANTGLGHRTGWGFEVDYPNDRIDCELGVHQFGSNLSPALGFISRPGTRWSQGGCEFRQRPAAEGKFSWIRLEGFEAYYNRITNENGVNETSRYFFSPISTTFAPGEHIEVNVAKDREFLPSPFAIVQDVSIAPGAYDFTRVRFLVQTSKHRWLQAGSTTWVGPFYSGRLTQWDHYVKVNTLKGRLQLGITTTNNYGRVREGSFAQRLWQTQFVFAFTPRLIFSSFVQYDNQSQNVGSNARLRWTIKPGRDLYIIWNRGWQRIIGTRNDLSLIPQNELLQIKLRWTIRR